MLKVITAAVKSSVKIFTVIGCVINRPHFENRLCVCVLLRFSHTQWKEKNECLGSEINAKGRVDINCKFNPFYGLYQVMLVFF